MKKLLTVFLVITLVVSALTVIPVSAVETDVAKGKIATGWYNAGTSFTDGNFISGYDPSKMTDGNDDTFVLAKVNNMSNHMLVVDLGQEYDIDKIRIKTVTTADAQAVQTDNGMSTTAVNSSACLFVADKAPVLSDFNGVNVATTDVVRINTDGANMNGIDKTYKTIGNTTSGAALGKHRYVGVYAPYSPGFAVSSLEVWADAEVEVPETSIETVSVKSQIDGSTAVMRFIFKPTFDGTVTKFGAYVIPYDLFENKDTKAVNSYTDGSLASGSTYSVDLTKIPQTAYGRGVVALPYIVLDGETVQGDATNAYTVNNTNVQK